MAFRFIPAQNITRQRTPKVENKTHLDFIRALPCLVCGAKSQAAHIRHNDARYLVTTGGAEKPDDKWTVPLCEYHHGLQTHKSEGRLFWDEIGIDAHALALMLFHVSPDIHTGRRVIIEWNNSLKPSPAR